MVNEFDPQRVRFLFLITPPNRYQQTRRDLVHGHAQACGPFPHPSLRHLRAPARNSFRSFVTGIDASFYPSDHTHLEGRSPNMSPSKPTEAEAAAFMADLLSGLDDSFFDAVPSPDQPTRTRKGSPYRSPCVSITNPLPLSSE